MINQKRPFVLLASLLFFSLTIVPGCAQSDTIRYIVRGAGVSEIIVNNVSLDEFMQPGTSFHAVTQLGEISDSTLRETEYGTFWDILMPGIELEYIDTGEIMLQRMVITNPGIPVMLGGENVFELTMNESTLVRLKAVENRDNKMSLMEKFSGAPEYWELLIDPKTGKVVEVILELGMH